MNAADPMFAGLKWDAHGLIPAIIQDAATRQVLMMAWMNADALRRTLETGKTHFYSRSRNKLWLKGESSGHVQQVVSVRTDCDRDCLLIEVRQTGAACHDGYYSCFYRRHDPSRGEWAVDGERVFDPAKVYGQGG
ncbi:MAG: phosphoribosyl-AMP cyclohydrolase [Tepidisphaerales bacterium]